MRTIRLYHPENLICGETTLLQTDTSTHLIKVLRTKIDTAVVLFNGDGFDYHCKTLDANSKKTQLSVVSRQHISNESNLSITLIQGLSRQDRMDTTIQKSVELGVTKIIPVICQRSNIKLSADKLIKKHLHWQRIVISACEQSGRCVIPAISEVLLLDDISQQLNQNSLKILLNPFTKAVITNDSKKDSIEIFVGPEGGLNDDEILSLEKNNFNSVRFGPRILRTETAGPAVISALQILWGDFGY